ncbi:hypothetical protein JCM11641_002312 [Rhodosporidiobolus odoratus]
MQHLFTGSAHRRPEINLGGRSDNRQLDLVQRARAQREQRDRDRNREKAAVKLQAFYRGHRSAHQSRQALRAQFDSLLAPTSNPSPANVLLASRLLAFFFRSSSPDDGKRAVAWCRAVLKPLGDADKTPLLFSLFSSLSWTPLIRRIGTSVLFLPSVSTIPSAQAPLFLEITKILCDPSSYAKYKAQGGARDGVPLLLESLVEDGVLYPGLRQLILSIPPTRSAHVSLPAGIALALLPFKAFRLSPPADKCKASPSCPNSPLLQRALLAFSTDILSIPSLPSRLAAKEAALFSSSLPFSDVLLALSSSSAAIDALDSQSAANISANLLGSTTPAGATRLQSITDAKTLCAYLELIARLLEIVGRVAFPPPSLGQKDSAEKGKAPEVEELILDGSEDEEEAGSALEGHDEADDTVMESGGASKEARNAPTLEPPTAAALAILHSRSHLLAVLALSTRFSASSRPSLARYLTTILALLPTAARAEALNTLVYAPSSSGLGLLRELFRGYVRSGRLGRFLGSAGRSDAGAVLSSLGDDKHVPKEEHEWPVLILTVELYRRALLTLGDDDFYASPQLAGPPASSSASAGVASRNPLSLDEVVTLSAIARNVAFSLYWVGAAEGEKVLSKTVVDTCWSYEELRSALTGFLVEVHARDSRRRFTPDGHWHMTSQFDIASFVQTAVYEEERLATENEADSGAPQPMDTDNSDDENPFSLRGSRRPAAATKEALLSKRQLALVSPRLGVLNNVPFVIPFETRVAIFRQFVNSDFQRLGVDSNGLIQRARHRAVVRRNHLAEDAYAHLNGLGVELKKRIEIAFIDEHGMEESGIDGGGLFKELLTSLSKEVFDPARGLWLETQNQELYPNPHTYAKGSSQLSWFQFLGRILGKALYQGILVNVRFADFFLAKWLGRQSYLDDLASLDQELYRGLINLKTYPGNVEEDLSLNFTITEDDFGVSRTIDLIPNGSETAVTNDNRMQYIVLVSHYRLNAQIAPQCRAFFAGLSEIISPRWLRMFNQSELAMLVGGTDETIDIEDLRQNTVYAGWSADENTPTVRWFWEAVASFSKEERAQLVRFVTACERPPLLGFKQLSPLFAIRKAGDDQERLPTSATCVNLLKLPEYTNSVSLRQKLLYAISSGAGFDLS